MSRALLIARVAFFFFQRFSSEPRGQPGSIVGLVSRLDAFWKVCFVGPSRTLPAVYVSAVIDGGSHPFPFRTRKLSLLSPMVLGLRARESRSLQDSRSPLPNGEGLLFFMPASLRSALATTTRQYESLVAHAPCPKGRGPLRFYTRPFGLNARKSLWPGLTLAITTGIDRSR